jgi:hypothetical protein
VFEQDFALLSPLITRSWLKHFWEFYQDKEFHHLGHPLPEIPSQSDTDAFIMPLFWSKDYKGITLRQRNLCQIN